MNTSEKDMLKEFDFFLSEIQEMVRGTRTNYMSWIRFLAKNHDLTMIRTTDDIHRILKDEAELQKLPNRKVYTTKKDLGNFRSTLNRFLPFILSWHAKHELKRSIVSFREMIDKIRVQATPEQAQTLEAAIRLLAIEKQYLLSAEELQTMKDNVRHVNTINYANHFYNGSNPTLIQF